MLDQNLFTLYLTPSTTDPTVLTLDSPNGQSHYTRKRVPGPTYLIQVYDPTTQSLLATATSPNATSKHKTVELCNPPAVVELKYTGTLSFKWSFQWEEHQFEWKREECFMIRKPDPPVLVAVTKEPAGKIKTSLVQILDYNLNRFDINDRKGLEIVILTALLTFQDSNDTYHSPNGTPQPSQTPSSSTVPTLVHLNPPTPEDSPPPAPPPKPPARTGIDRISEMQLLRPEESEYNEVTVVEEGSVEDYGRFIAENLLGDDALLFAVVKSASPEMVPKVLLVVEWAKRLRYKAGEDDIHQYVQYDYEEVKKGPRRINLDDVRKSAMDYKPPQSLKVHLSKIPMPELAPRAKPSISVPPPPPPEDKDVSGSKDKKKDKKDKQKERNKDKDKDKNKAKKGTERTTSPPASSSSLRPPSSPETGSNTSRVPNRLSGLFGGGGGGALNATPPHIHSYQTHPHQPSPSPLQLNNPGIYTAPPPPPPAVPPRPVQQFNFPPGYHPPTSQQMHYYHPPPSSSAPGHQQQQGLYGGMVDGIMGALSRRWT